MKTEVQLFSNPKFGDIRILQNEYDEPLFCLADVCSAVGIVNSRNVRQRLDKDDVHQADTIDSLGRNQSVTFVTESGFYDVIIRSDSPTAKPFRKWVTSEVLPTIRKSGGYMVSKEDDTPEVLMARALLLAKDTMERQSKELEKERQRRLDIEQQRNILEGQKQIIEEANTILAPKAKYTDEVLQSTSTFTLTQIALDLGLRSVHVLTGLLSDKGLMYRQSGQWLPTAKVADKKYFTTRTYPYVKSNGTIATSISTVITEKGRMFLHNLLKTLETA